VPGRITGPLSHRALPPPTEPFPHFSEVMGSLFFLCIPQLSSSPPSVPNAYPIICSHFQAFFTCGFTHFQSFLVFFSQESPAHLQSILIDFSPHSQPCVMAWVLCVPNTFEFRTSTSFPVFIRAWPYFPRFCIPSLFLVILQSRGVGCIVSLLFCIYILPSCLIILVSFHLQRPCATRVV